MGFYCESCGNEVKRNSDTCPTCGVRFKAVKCPSCGYTDKAELFKAGCPVCSYMAPEEKIEIRDPDPGKKRGGPFLHTVPAAAFWASGAALLLLLMILLKVFLE
ncbi:MAG: hypothetical protein PQJ58_23125 [Spirochaetales bacterium]|nr:hypothetical protein [Spirochaetales bacterium]